MFGYRIGIGLVVLAAFAASCSTVPYRPYARDVKRVPSTGGIVALKEDHRPEDRALADTLMASNCGSTSVRISEEGEVVTGSKTNTSAKKSNDREHESAFQWGAVGFGGQDKNVENTAVDATTVAVKEWQIRYECATGASTPSKDDSKSESVTSVTRKKKAVKGR